MNHLPAKYDFYPGCRAVVVSGGSLNAHLIGKIVTCIRDTGELTMSGNPIWEIDIKAAWRNPDLTISYEYAMSQIHLMPLPPPDGIILSEEELLLICQ